MTSVWDKKTWTQYAYFKDGGLVSFDNENAICAKTEYCLNHDLGGFIIWELSGDVMEDLSTPLLDVVNKKLSDPSYRCGEPGTLPDGGVDLPRVSTPPATVQVGSPPNSVESEVPSILLSCGSYNQGSFSVDDSKQLSLSFKYELHRYTSVSLINAASDIKESVVDNIAEKLNCFGIPRRTRRTASNGKNPVATSQQYVTAVLSSYSDQPETLG